MVVKPTLRLQIERDNRIPGYHVLRDAAEQPRSRSQYSHAHCDLQTKIASRRQVPSKARNETQHPATMGTHLNPSRRLLGSAANAQACHAAAGISIAGPQPSDTIGILVSL